MDSRDPLDRSWNTPGMNEVSDREGFMVIYPQGTTDSEGNTFFNVGYEFHKDSTIDDVSFIRDLFVSLSEEYGLKRKQGFCNWNV